jgi:F0F1-type ATP synthase assembly protein I
MSEPERLEKDRRQKAYNLTLAAVASQVGCLTIVIIVGALIAGLQLDKLFATKPLFTIIFMIVSMPVTLFLMIWVVKSATSRIKPVIEKKNKENLEGGSES